MRPPALCVTSFGNTPTTTRTLFSLSVACTQQLRERQSITLSLYRYCHRWHVQRRGPHHLGHYPVIHPITPSRAAASCPQLPVVVAGAGWRATCNFNMTTRHATVHSHCKCVAPQFPTSPAATQIYNKHNYNGSDYLLEWWRRPHLVWPGRRPSWAVVDMSRLFMLPCCRHQGPR